MKIVVLDSRPLDLGDLDWQALNDLGDVTIYEQTSPEQVVERANNAEIILTNKVVLGEEHFGALPKLRYIGVLATGYNIVDVNAARTAGIIVTNIPSYGTAAVSQHVFALLLEITNRVASHSQQVISGEWERSGMWCMVEHPIMELANKTMGIIGLGRIGQQTARIAQAFDMKVLAFDPYPRGDLESDSLHFVGLDELLRSSDVIVLHSPLTPENYRMINKDSIAKMKQGVILINNSRGPLIDEADLAEALQSGKVRAVGLDVLEVEPPVEQSPLFGAPGSFFTPHNSWAAFESRSRLLEMAVRNVQAFLAGVPVNVVNRS